MEKKVIIDGEEKVIRNINTEETLSYIIPDEILKELSEIKNFKTQLFEELDNVFGKGKWFEHIDCDKVIYGHTDESTCGWSKALEKVLVRNGKENVWEYYNKLWWYDSDLFDDQICQMVCEREDE